MIELSHETLEQILHKETAKTEELTTILRSIYTRYMRLYERYFADIDSLNDQEIAEMRSYHAETGSLVKYYYLDIPLDICLALREFEEKYSARLLGPDWQRYLSDSRRAFMDQNRSRAQSGKDLKAEFAKQALTAFYDAMGYIFRESFGTGSQTAKQVLSGISGLLFGKD